MPVFDLLFLDLLNFKNHITITFTFSSFAFVFVYLTDYSHASKFPNSALKRPLFPEFDNLYYVEFKRQQTARRKEKELLVINVI